MALLRQPVFDHILHNGFDGRFKAMRFVQAAALASDEARGDGILQEALPKAVNGRPMHSK
ncbi:hypothetical protein GO286_04857 [Ralstonia solanacearum]|nr:hypothetical protein [Ralstonia solanacearum]